MMSPLLSFSLQFCILASVAIPSFHLLKIPPTNTSSFRTLLEANAYVDKTEFLLPLIKNESNKFHLLSRPRQFGKSLLIDTLNEFYQGNRSVFYGTKIHDAYPQDSWTRYPIVRLDLSSMNYNTSDQFRDSVINSITTVADSYNLGLEISRGESIHGNFPELLKSLKKKFGLPVVVLIDEYDSLLNHHEPHSVAAKAIAASLNTLFVNLKTHEELVQFCLVVGVTRLPWLPLSTLFYQKISNDITFLPEFASIVGFTEEELRDNFQEAIDQTAKYQKNSSDVVLQELQILFDGYQFSCKSQRIYNPCSVAEYLRTNGSVRDFWVQSGSSTSRLFENLSEFPDKVLENIFVLHRANLSSPISLEKPMLTVRKNVMESRISYDYELERTLHIFEKLIRFLTWTGYLTIDQCATNSDGDSVYSLRFPNQEVQTEYEDVISKIVYPKEPNRLKKMAESYKELLVSYKWQKFIDEVNLYMEQTRPYGNLSADPANGTVTPAQKEKWYRLLFQTAMLLGGFNYSYVHLEVPIMDEYVVVMEDSSGVYITVNKLEGNQNESLSDQCSKKYIPMFVHLEKKIVCVALVFSDAEKKIISWGAKVCSDEGHFKFMGNYGPLMSNNSTSPEIVQSVA